MPQSRDDKRGLVAHVGFHKTASTLIQDRLLVTENGFYSPWPIQHHLDKIVLSNPYLDAAIELRSVYTPALAEAVDQGMRLAISHEALLGNPYDGGNRFPDTRYVERLVDAFPDITIIVTVREQVSMLTSMYKHSISAGHTWDIDTFLAPSQPNTKTFGFEFLEYSWPVIRLQTLVGADRVVVIPFEWLRTDPERFVRTFGKLSGRPIAAESVLADTVNSGLGSSAASLKRHANRLLPHHQPRRTRVDIWFRAAANKIVNFKGHQLSQAHEARLESRVREAVGDRYGESNAALSRAIGVDLHDLGYQTQSE